MSTGDASGLMPEVLQHDTSFMCSSNFPGRSRVSSNTKLLMGLMRRPCMRADSRKQLGGGNVADLVPEVLEALKPQHHAVRICDAVTEEMHTERLGKDPQRLPHVRHIWHVGRLSGLQALTPCLQDLIHKALHATLDLQKCRTQ